LTLLGTLRRTEPWRLRRWHKLAALALLLSLRAVLYWELGGALAWMPKLRLGVITVTFRSDFLSRMFLFSLLSFGVALAVFYLWLLLLSVLAPRSGPGEALGKLVRTLLGPAARLGIAAKLLVPGLGGWLLWLPLSALLEWIRVLPPALSLAHRLEQGVLIGLYSYLTWPLLTAGLLALHLVNSYVHLGEHPFWDFVHAASRPLLQPWRKLPLRVGRVDLAPLAVLAAVLLVGQGLGRLLTRLYERLPL
jgi:uncharacterized protein YggT (Ycf19 family)